MHIHQVDTQKRSDVERFINVPHHIYRASDLWAPPMRSDARLQLNREKNGFYKHNDATFFIATSEKGEMLGRIAVLDPQHHNTFKEVQHAFFYLFDVVDDAEVSQALFDRAAEWADARGLDTIRGPLGFMALDGFGMLAEGFDHRPALGIPYNYQYYNDHVTGLGFELEERILSGYLDVDKVRREFPERVLKLGERVQKRYGFRMKEFASKRQAMKWAAPRLVELYNKTLTHITGDPPVHQDEVDVAARQLMQVGKLDLFKLVVQGEEEDRLVGFIFCYPDIHQGIQRSRGRLWPLGWLHLLRDLNKTQWLNINGMGILPEYQGVGPSAFLYAELYKSVTLHNQYKHVDVVQISEANPRMLRDLENFGVKFYKAHHVYQKSI